MKIIASFVIPSIQIAVSLIFTNILRKLIITALAKR